MLYLPGASNAPMLYFATDFARDEERLRDVQDPCNIKGVEPSGACMSVPFDL